jgi:hypothetical protein
MGKVFQGSNTGNAQAFLYDYYPYTFTSGSVYTNSIYLKASYNLPTLAFNSYINSSSGGQHNIANSVNFTGISTQWTRYTATHTITQQANGVGGIGWSLGTLPSGCIIYASMPQLENKAFATSFVQGTRATGVLNYPIELLNPYEGTISFWWKPSSYWDYDTKGANHERILYTGNPDIAHDYFQIGRYSSSDTIRTLIQIGGSSKSLQFSTTETGGMNIYNNYHFICVKWSVSNNEYALFFDGVKKTTTMPVGRIDWSGFPLYLGTRDGQQPMNAIINELRIDNVAKTDEEITSWYIANKPFYNPYDYRGYAY